MGEGCGNDAELMRHISSANIACGFHAGNEETMKATVELAVENGVAIGAHPGYADRENFGRLPMDLSAQEVKEIVSEQISTLRSIVTRKGTKLTHVKPHGALYNQAARSSALSAAIADAVYSQDPHLILFCLSGSVMIVEAHRRGLRTANEVFADRTYQADGSLTPRTQPNALIEDTATAVAQALSMIQKHSVTAVDGTIVNLTADTICLHGDGSHAVEFATALRDGLSSNGVKIAPIRPS
ncbi:MAG: LamB/YcsF family protein [Acidobacteria bacterium]|nr:LamB/YcsF family protein [Acidobacteriota bacterium]